MQRLEDERAILDRLHAHCHPLDDGWLDCWTQDGVLAWPHVLVPCDGGAWRIRERRLERESLIPGAPVT